MTALPSVIPLFPLPNVVLFPGVPLPLHIFEPRYRDMVRDTPAGESSVIGMVLLRGDWRKRYYGNPEIFAVGCAGRVMSVEPLPDGRYNILLHGLREFVVEQEQRDKSYRQGHVRWRTPVGGRLDGDRRARLLRVVRQFADTRGPEAAQKLLADRSISDELLVNFFCYAFDLAPLEKQSLLEATSLSDRADRLCEIVEFALGAGASTDPGHERYH